MKKFIKSSDEFYNIDYLVKIRYTKTEKERLKQGRGIDKDTHFSTGEYESTSELILTFNGIEKPLYFLGKEADKIWEELKECINIINESD